MPLTGDTSTNPDKTQNFSITGVKELDSGSIVSATGFVNGQRQGHDFTRPNAPPYSNAGLSLGAENSAGSIGLTGTHIPNRADILAASTDVHLVNTDTHRLTANAFTSTVMPKAGPNFATHGGGVEYMFKNTVGANASVSHTPMFKQTDYSVGGKLNLHQTPTSSFGLNLGATKSDSPFSKGNWQPGGSFQFKKYF
ncbi:defense protein 3-like [Maniola hyperantus]|uniref:defense protein 3-like n=1 Tax=Aphantopus hyperantus TaxID=2795564 RepID=UPI00156835DD|nr:defense protein 3-like [Maniola hyperantus]